MSKDWDGAKADLTSGYNYGYNFTDINVSSVNGSPGYDPSLGIEGAANNLEPIFDGHADVLGVAHDYGGMILRQLANQESKLSALILSGVPNKGSVGIEDIINVVDGQSNATDEIERFQDIISPESCSDCGLYNKFRGWVKEIENGAGSFNGPDLYEEIASSSPIVADLNDNLPQVPFAIMYGTVDNFSVAQLMDAQVSVSGYTPEGSLFSYNECYQRELEQLEAEIEIDRLKREIKVIRSRPKSLFQIALGGASKSVSAGGFDPSSIINVVTGLLNRSVEKEIAGIEGEISEILEDQEDIRMLICRIAQDYISARWELLLLQNANYEVEAVEVEATAYTPEFGQCVNICELDVYYGDLPSNTDCDEECEDWLATTTEIEYVISYEGHDGILLESEQRLDGAELAKTYHLENTNHFQEQSMLNDDVASAFTDLFDGNAGTPFFVPKN